MISNIALSKRRKSSRFLGTTFDSSPGSLVNQGLAVYNRQLNLVQLAQLQRLQKLKLLHNSFNSTIPKMNQLLNKSNGDRQPTESAKTNISNDKMLNQVGVHWTLSGLQ